MCQLVTAIALLVLLTGKLGKCAPVGDCCSSPCKAYSKLGKCVPVGDCCSSPCKAYRQAGEVCASW